MAQFSMKLIPINRMYFRQAFGQSCDLK